MQIETSELVIYQKFTERYERVGREGRKRGELNFLLPSFLYSVAHMLGSPGQKRWRLL
jgi:hypothetical protein